MRYLLIAALVTALSGCAALGSNNGEWTDSAPWNAANIINQLMHRK